MTSRQISRLSPLNTKTPPAEAADPVPLGLSAETVIRIDSQPLKIHAKDLELIKELGRGQYGRVEKKRHRPSGRLFAVKLIAIYQEHINRIQIQRDLEVGQNTTCPCVVMCYGGLFHDSEVLVLMELMDMSLDDLRIKVKEAQTCIPVNLLAYMFQRVVTGLEFLRAQLNIMHRDVKPSNMLTDRHGLIKVCDFGISGEIIKSTAPSNVGSNRYLAPERINPSKDSCFRIQSDVWSLGLSVMELCTLDLCYANIDDVFNQLIAVVDSPPLRLPENDCRYPEDLRIFISRCLVKEVKTRASYLELLKTDFLSSVNIIEDQDKLASFLIPFIDE